MDCILAIDVGTQSLRACHRFRIISSGKTAGALHTAGDLQRQSRNRCRNPLRCAGSGLPQIKAQGSINAKSGVGKIVVVVMGYTLKSWFFWFSGLSPENQKQVNLCVLCASAVSISSS